MQTQRNNLYLWNPRNIAYIRIIYWKFLLQCGRKKLSRLPLQSQLRQRQRGFGSRLQERTDILFRRTNSVIWNLQEKRFRHGKLFWWEFWKQHYEPGWDEKNGSSFFMRNVLILIMMAHTDGLTKKTKTKFWDGRSSERVGLDESRCCDGNCEREWRTQKSCFWIWGWYYMFENQLRKFSGKTEKHVNVKPTENLIFGNEQSSNAPQNLSIFVDCVLHLVNNKCQLNSWSSHKTTLKMH